MEKLSPRAPGFAVRLRQDRAITVVDFAHDDHSRSGTVLVATLFHEIHGDVWVRNNQGGLSPDPEGEDGTVFVCPFLELDPGFCFGDVEFVADEWERGWSWWQTQPCDDVLG